MFQKKNFNPPVEDINGKFQWVESLEFQGAHQKLKEKPGFPGGGVKFKKISKSYIISYITLDLETPIQRMEDDTSTLIIVICVMAVLVILALICAICYCQRRPPFFGTNAKAKFYPEQAEVGVGGGGGGGRVSLGMIPLPFGIRQSLRRAGKELF